MSTVQNADVIFVLDGGRVVEVGNHRELVAMKGVYWQMVWKIYPPLPFPK